MKTLKMLAGGVIALALAAVSAQAATVGYTNNSNLTVAAGDTLSVGTGSASTLSVAVNLGQTRTLNASAADAVRVNVGTLGVGVGGGDNNTGTLNLSVDNIITASSAFNIGYNGTNEHGTVTTAAGGTTVIYTPIMRIGEARLSNSSFTLGSNASLQLEGLSGGLTDLRIGREYQTSSGLNWSAVGNMNLSGGTASLKLSRLTVGESAVAASDPGGGTGTLTLSGSANNHLDVSNSGSVVRIGYSSGGNTTTGTVTIGNLNATSVITSTDDSTAILLGYKTSTDSATGTLNLNGGTLKITTGGAAIAGGGGTSRLYLDGGAKLIAGAASTDWIHSLSTAEIKSGGATIDTDGYDISVSQAFSGAGGLIKDGLGALELEGDSTYTGTTQITAGTLMLSGSVDGDVNVGANGTLSGLGDIGGNIHFDSGSSLAFGSVFTTASGKSVSFGGFSVANIVGLDEYAADGTYTLISGQATINWANVTNVGEANKVSIGGSKSAYFQAGSLQLVVIPEPATFGIVLGVLAAAVIRRRRFPI